MSFLPNIPNLPGLLSSYTAGNFELMLDGHPGTAYLRTIEGGFMRTAPIDEPIGPDNLRIKHTSVAEIEPLLFECGMSGADGVMKWIRESWNKDYGRRNGIITHANFNQVTTFEHEFYDALITETTFPTLDGNSREPAYLKVKLQPERVVTRKVIGKTFPMPTGPQQKLWACSSFRLLIDGLPETIYANRIESFTIRQGLKQFYTGEDRLCQLEPTKIEFPSITATISVAYAFGLIKWYDDYVCSGMADPRAQRAGILEFLSPDRDIPIFQLYLYDVGLNYLGFAPSQANSDNIQRLKFELYVGRMDIDPFSLGMRPF